MPGRFAERSRGARAGDVRAELLGLHERALRQITTGDAGREAEVVLDPRTRSRLPSGHEAFDGESAESFRRAVHRGGEPSRAPAHDQEVEAPIGEAVDGQAEVLRHRSGRCVRENRPGHDHDRQVGAGNAQLVDQSLDGFVALGIQPFVWNATAGEELSQRVRLGTMTRAKKSDR